MSLSKIEIGTIIAVLSAAIGFGIWIGTLQEKVAALEEFRKEMGDLGELIDKVEHIDRKIDKSDKWREFYIIKLKKEIWTKWFKDLENDIATQDAPATIKQTNRSEGLKRELERLRSRETGLEQELEQLN